MSTTELLSLDEISSSQASKEITHNTALRQIEGRMLRAKDKDLTTPPGSPAAGDTYIIPSGASGVWASKTNQIAHFYGGAWTYWTPIEGVRLWLNDEDTEYVFDGSAWIVLAGSAANPPFTDTTAIVKGSATSSKQARFEVDGLTVATTRILTVQDRNYTLAGTDDVATAAATGASDLAAHAAAADPHTGYQKESEKAAANGYASLDAGTLVPAAQLPALVGDSGSGGIKGAAPAPASGDAAAGKFLKADGTWAAVSGASGGTVTSVALTVPAELSVSGSPITASGTLAITKANQSANLVYAGPTSGGAAAPAFRALVAADIPTVPIANGGTGQTTQTAAFDALDPLTTKGDVIVHNGTNSVRLPVGSNTQVLTADSGEAEGLKWAAAGASGLTNFTEAKSTATPNATVPVVSLTATSSETSIDVAVKPKGNGAISAQIADNTTTGGNKRGLRAVDWSMERAAATHVASGDYSVVSGGYANAAKAAYGVVAGGNGNQCETTGGYNTIGGGLSNSVTAGHSTVAGGTANNASGAASTIGGGNTGVASGSQSTVAGGLTNTASGLTATVGGGSINTASGTQSTVGGGTRNVADGSHSCVPGGRYGTARGRMGTLVFASGVFTGTTPGHAQSVKQVLRAETTNATPAVLTADGGAADTTNIPILPNDSTYTFKGLVSARGTASGNSSGWEFTGVIKRGANAAATALVAAVTPTLIAQDAGAATWVLAVTADTTNGGLSVTVTGVAATTIRWVATIDTVEVTN